MWLIVGVHEAAGDDSLWGRVARKEEKKTKRVILKRDLVALGKLPWASKAWNKPEKHSTIQNQSSNTFRWARNAPLRKTPEDASDGVVISKLFTPLCHFDELFNDMSLRGIVWLNLQRWLWVKGGERGTYDTYENEGCYPGADSITPSNEGTEFRFAIRFL